MAMTSHDPTTIMAASPEQKFNAAVKVIRGLPKNGSFQPSHELMLKFYAYFKQATEGPCTSPKPGIWNLVNRRKWEAWSELGEMERETAMLLYVEELKNVSKHVRDTLYPPEIVETMPQTEQVTDFVETIGAFYELIDEDNKGLPITTNGDSNGLPIATSGDSSGLPVATNIDSNGLPIATSRNSSGLPIATNGPVDYTESDKLDHSDSIGEMLRISNAGDSKQGESGGETSESDNNNSTDTIKSNPHAVTSNGHAYVNVHDRDNNNDDEDGEGEKPRPAEHGIYDSQRVDSGSETDEFVDTSDQIIQPASRTSSIQGEVSYSASPSVDGRRETRVRFAPYLNTAVSPNSCMVDGVTSLHNTALHDLSTSSSQMLKDRLALGTPIGMTFLPQSGEYIPRNLSESLHVNESFSSLASLADDSVAGDDLTEERDTALDLPEDTESMMDVIHDKVLLTSTSDLDFMTSRGGEEEGPSQATGGWNPVTHGGASSAPRGARDSGRSKEGRTRHRPLPPGSGGGGRGGRGQGRGPEISMDKQILLAMVRMQQDMAAISNRLNTLELYVRLHREKQDKKAVKKSSWWPFSGMPKTLVFLLIVWPFLAPIIVNLICQRRHRALR